MTTPMGRIRHHIPMWAADMMPPDRLEGRYANLQELLEVPFVKHWAEHKDFYRFSYEDNCLLAELDGGFSWWVVGHFNAIPDGLPRWDKGRKRVLDENGAMIVVEGRDIDWSCGDQVGLRDGRVLTKAPPAPTAAESQQEDWAADRLDH